ncbi:hypothetical protein L1787_01665 [Acuticoccus sp. M5D2P5]|nr:SRPBCC domain-containing protein [Acuticoccus kalidii]MCF3932120.1 hypothetical protein [Acuticoccus kalidii]
MGQTSARFDGIKARSYVRIIGAGRGKKLELTGEKVIKASQTAVYDALHDPVVLRQAIPGCHALRKLDEDSYEMTAGLKVGPLRIDPVISIEVYNEDRPAGYSIRGEANAGENGTARGNAHVALAAIDGWTTNLAYHLTISLRGEIGSLETAVLDPAARTLVAEFFSRLQLHIEGPHEREADPEPALADAAPAAAVVASRPWAEIEAEAMAREAERAELEPAFAETRSVEPSPRPMTEATSGPMTDATGAYIGHEATTERPAAGDEPAMRQEAEPARATPMTYTPPSSFGQASRDAPIVEEPISGAANIWRWFLVLVGLVIIALLLSDGF